MRYRPGGIRYSQTTQLRLPLPGSTRARPAAGKIHTDIERGFVAAEVVNWKDLVEAGGYAGARERAQLRVEGREYEMRDGDVITVRFSA